MLVYYWYEVEHAEILLVWRGTWYTIGMEWNIPACYCYGVIRVKHTCGILLRSETYWWDIVME